MNKTMEKKRIDFNSCINQDIKGKFVSREIYCNVNSLMQDIEYEKYCDDIENYYYLSCPECNGEMNLNEDTNIYECTDCDHKQKDEPEQEVNEVLEWWAISNWLFEKLRDKGHVVIDYGSTYIWGRCTSGQAILLDNVISQICNEMEILEGQQYDWSKK